MFDIFPDPFGHLAPQDDKEQPSRSDDLFLSVLAGVGLGMALIALLMARGGATTRVA